MKKHLLTALVALSVVGAVGQSRADAGTIVNNFGLVAPDFTLTFDEIVFPDGTGITNEYAAYGVTFEPTIPGMVYNAQGPVSFPGIDGNYLGNFGDFVNNPFSIVFSAPHQNVAFGMATNPANTTFTALLGNTVVESFTTSTTFDDVAAGYYGFVNILFDEIQVSVDDFGAGNYALIDNIQTNDDEVPVPEPATIFLVGGGMAMAAFRRRRAGTNTI